MKNITLEIFARRLKQLRNQHNLTTRELGEIVGTSNATISRYEKGDRDPDLLVAQKIASYFGVTIEYLCGEEVGLETEQLIGIYSKLTSELKEEAMKYITYLYEKGEK